jgi:hypothetical protein
MQPLIPGNYTAETLIATIDANLKLLHSGFSCTLNPINGLCTIKNTNVSFELYMASYTNTTVAKRTSFWGLGYYLGFRQTRLTSVNNTDGTYSLTATSVINVQQNQYYLLQLSYPDQIVNVTHRLQDKGSIEAFAKIILKDGSFTIAFDDNSNLLRKEFTFLAPVTIPQCTVSLLNQYGEPVNMMNVDWSITLEFTEIVNSKTYMKLSNTYNK